MSLRNDLKGYARRLLRDGVTCDQWWSTRAATIAEAMKQAKAEILRAATQKGKPLHAEAMWEFIKKDKERAMMQQWRKVYDHMCAMRGETARRANSKWWPKDKEWFKTRRREKEKEKEEAEAAEKKEAEAAVAAALLLMSEGKKQGPMAEAIDAE